MTGPLLLAPPQGGWQCLPQAPSTRQPRRCRGARHACLPQSQDFLGRLGRLWDEESVGTGSGDPDTSPPLSLGLPLLRMEHDSPGCQEGPGMHVDQ